MGTVLAEEMIHLALAANLLHAVGGGSPDLDAPPQSDEYRTIGQFYAAIEAGLLTLCDQMGEEQVFSGDPARQIGEFHLRGGGGEVLPVVDLKSASAALAEIVSGCQDGHEATTPALLEVVAPRPNSSFSLVVPAA